MSDAMTMSGAARLKAALISPSPKGLGREGMEDEVMDEALDASRKSADEMTAGERLNLVREFGGWVFLNQDGLIVVDFPDVICAADQRFLKQLLCVRREEVTAILRAREPARANQPNTILVEPACPCDFLPYPHIVSSLDCTVRRQHDAALATADLDFHRRRSCLNKSSSKEKEITDDQTNDVPA